MITYRKYLLMGEYPIAMVIPNIYNNSLGTFIELAKIMKKAFPGAKDEDFYCHTVVKSSWCEGMPVVVYRNIPKIPKLPKDWLITNSNLDVKLS